MAQNDAGFGVSVELDSTFSPTLQVEYLRLASWYPQPERVNLATFRIAVHNPTKTSVGAGAIAAGNTRATVNRALPLTVACMGTDRQTGQARCAALTETGKMLEATWTGVVSSQLPSMLAFLMQKTSDQFILGGVDADNPRTKNIQDWDYTVGAPTGLGIARGEMGGLQNHFLSRNTDAAAAILQFELQIQSSVGSYSYSGDTFPYVKTKFDLWRDTLKNACDGYMGGSMEKWHKHQCILLLNASDYARGLASSGSAYPVTLNARVKFISRREYIGGSGAVSSLSRGACVQQDKIAGQPVMLQIFPQQSLQLSASSGLLSSQNLSHAQAQQILSQY